MDAANLEDLRVGPWPTEAESALLLTQAAYTKAQCLSWDIEDQGLLRLSKLNMRSGGHWQG